MSAGGSIDDAVRAMGHPGRRAMLRLAIDEERSAGELADVAGLSPSAASPHLKLLRDTGLMHMRVDAKRRLYRVDLQRLADVRAALDQLWGDRLGALKQHAEAETTKRSGRARRKRSA
jgi:DNA-binding transcriptional ArsR family regulator